MAIVCFMKSQSLIKDIRADSLSLLHGKPILVPTAGFSIIPKQLKDICSYGQDLFFRDLRLLTEELPIESIPETEEVEECVKNYFLLLSVMKESEQFRTIYIKALNFFTDMEASYSEEEDLLFYKIEEESHLITPGVLEAIKFILCKQYNIEIVEKENPGDEIAKKIIEKQKKAREKLAAIKQSTETSSIEFSDLISAVAIQVPGLNILNI